MKSVSAFVVPATTLLLVITATSLALDANEAVDATVAARSGLAQARVVAGDVANAAAALTTAFATASATSPLATGGVANEAVADDPPPNVNGALALTLVRLQKQAKARSVSIERITAANKQQGYSGADALTTPVPMTGNRILAVRLQMQGRYADYLMFKLFIDDVGHLTSVQSLKITGDRFEATLEIYGVGNA